MPDKIDINDYEYICYVDGSGNDGNKFDNPNGGSSDCFSVAYFLMKPIDSAHNAGIIEQCKRLMNVNKNSELKYKTIRRHKNKDAIIRLLRDLRGAAGSMTFFKRLLVNDPIINNLKAKSLTIATHAIIIHRMFAERPGIRILAVVDRMKSVEMKGVESLNMFQNQLIFRDSNDTAFPFLQIADIMAGITREFFEGSQTSVDHKFYSGRCNVCGKKKNLCRHERTHKLQITAWPLFRIRALFRDKYKQPHPPEIWTHPLELLEKEYVYIACWI